MWPQSDAEEIARAVLEITGVNIWNETPSVFVPAILQTLNFYKNKH